MRIFLAGATGALGRRLLPLLVRDGHSVVAGTRTPEKVDRLCSVGAEPAVVDILDRAAVRALVAAVRPDVVVHQVTALAGVSSLRRFELELAATNRLRTEGTENLLAAARDAGARRLVAQSYTGWPNARHGGRTKTEDDPLDPDPPRVMRSTLDAIRRLESAVVGATGLTGVVLRYGSFYGPGTAIALEGDVVKLVRRRRFPILGDGSGVWSFVHVDDAAEATRLAILDGPAGIYNVVDDEPAEVATWLPELARAVGAPPPRRLPAWLGRLAAGEAAVSMMTRVRGSSNAKAKRGLGWQPRYGSWRDGFRRGLGPEGGSGERVPS